MNQRQANGRSPPAMEPIRVFVRLRPAEDDAVCVDAQSSTSIALLPPASTTRPGAMSAARDQSSQPKMFQFDRVFAAHRSQSDVYAAVSHLVKDVVDGYNCTVFAYGCTGSGKTHTMFGNPSSPGIVPRVVEDLFAQLTAYSRGNDAACMVYLSYVELYNNYFYDLLTERPDLSGDRVTLRDSNTYRGVYLTGSPGIRKPVSSSDDVLGLIRHGDKYRATNATALNDRSSRSHAIISLEVEVQQTAEESSSSGEHSDTVVQIGKINLVDLAGSERVAWSHASGQTLTEAQNINLALTVLGDVLSALSKQHKQAGPPTATAGSTCAKQFIPYRNSKLTHLLKDSLGGNSRTIMIATLRQGSQFYQQTQICLRYAARARHIQNMPVHNTDSAADQATIRANLSEIARLKQQLLSRSKEFEQLKRQAALGTSQSEEMHTRLDALQRRNQQEKEELESHLRCIIHGHEGKLAEQEHAYNHLQGQLEVYELAVRKQKQKIKHLRISRQETEAKHQETHVENVRLSQDLEDLKAGKAVLEQHNLELRQELEKLADHKYVQWDQERLKYRSAMALLAKERDQYRSQCEHLQQLQQQGTLRDGALKGKLSGLVSSANDQLMEHQQRFMQQLQKLDAESQRLAASAQKVAAAKHAHRATLKEARIKHNVTADKLGEAETQLALYKTEREVADLEKSRMQGEAQQQVKHLQATINQLEGRVGRREQCLVKQQEQQTQRTTRIMTIATNFSASMSASLERLQSTVDQKLQVISSSTRQLERKLSLLAGAIPSMEQLSGNLRAANEGLRTKADENAALKSELQAAVAKLDAHRKDLVVASNKILKLQKSESKAKERVTQLEAVPSSVEDLVRTQQARTEELQHELDALLQRRYDDMDEWGRKETELTSRLEELVDANTQLERDINNKESELVALKEAFEGEQRNSASLRDALKQKAKQFAAKEDLIRQEMDKDFKHAVDSVRKFINVSTNDTSQEVLHIDIDEDTDCSFTSLGSSERAVAASTNF